MKKLLLLTITFFIACSNEPISDEMIAAVDLVNPLAGSDSEYSLSNGNTYPAIALPWGMNFWTPQTNIMGNGWIYQYDAANNSRENVYIHTAELDGNSYDRNYIRHEDILNGAKLTYSMSDKANTKRGTGPEDAPFSVSSTKIQVK